MSLVCVVSQRGAPGVTLTALAVTARWPAVGGRQVVLVEADPAGGVLGLRYRLGTEPGLVTLAAALRSGGDGPVVWDHAQRLAGGVPAVVAPDGAEQVDATLRAVAERLGRWLGGLEGVDVVADLGRLSVGSPAEPLVVRADVVLMVARPTVEQLQPAARRLGSLAGECPQVGWVLVGEEPHGAGEVEAAYGFDVVGVMADDPRGAAAVEGDGTWRRISRSPLARSAGSLAGDLVGWWLDPTAATGGDRSGGAEQIDVRDAKPGLGESSAGSVPFGLSAAMTTVINNAASNGDHNVGASGDGGTGVVGS